MALVTLSDYPKIAFNYKILNLNFEASTIQVKYTPTDTRLTAFEFVLPILPDFDPNAIDSYVERFAPYDKWHGQSQIILHGDTILNLTNTVNPS